MKSVLVLAVLVGVAVAGTTRARFLHDDFISEINNAKSTWTAKRQFPIDTPLSHFQKLASLKGISSDPNFTLPIIQHKISADLPDTFDAREHWPDCPTIGTIRDQGQCGSCWAFGAAESMSDRLCIQKGVQFTFAPEELVSCCTSCGFGCDGGYLLQAWQYWKSHGIVSGGDQGSGKGCRPYTAGTTGVTPTCSQKCVSTYDKTYKEDLKFGVSAYSVSSNEEQIKQEIFENGPVEVAFDVYEDFMNYESGVYQHVSGGYLGGHAVKLLGWGEENGTPYWLIANSWNTNWGINGLFKFVRGKNHCGIEGNVVGGKSA